MTVLSNTWQPGDLKGSTKYCKVLSADYFGNRFAWLAWVYYSMLLGTIIAKGKTRGRWYQGATNGIDYPADIEKEVKRAER